jgi:SAM-dependent methyltransferase
VTGIDQSTIWNGHAGRAWVEQQELLDGMLRAARDKLLDVLRPGDRVIDVGCGTGATTLAAADRVGANGSALGVDISEPMIAHARRRAERSGSRATFVVANAEDYRFEPESHDAVISRFGVMFFDNAVRAFSGLRKALTSKGRLRFIAWRKPSDNPFMTTSERAVGHLLPNLSPRDPDAPGQFAFADPKKVEGILERSEWRGVTLEPIDLACAFPVEALDRYVSQMGPVGVALQEADESTRAKVIALAKAAFDAYRVGDEIRFTAACWLVDALPNDASA